MVDCPLPLEVFFVGLIGIILNFLIIYFSIKSALIRMKSKSTKRFFFFLTIMSIFEFPRFVLMMITMKYDSKVAYCFHIISGLFFFISFSIVCRQWSGLLELGAYFKPIYGTKGLLLSNILFGVVDFSSVVILVLSDSLSSYFSSEYFEITTFVEGIRNVTYSVFLSYYGVKLINRFWHFSAIERQATSISWWDILNQNVLDCLSDVDDSYTRSRENKTMFTKVLFRLTSILILSSGCFLCRISMLATKMIALHSQSRPVTNSTFTLFGIIWFSLSDFIPRYLPAFAFILLMRTRNPEKASINDPNVRYLPTNRCNLISEVFTWPLRFMKLPSNEPEPGAEEIEMESDSKRQLIAHSDQFVMQNPMLTPGTTSDFRENEYKSNRTGLGYIVNSHSASSPSDLYDTYHPENSVDPGTPILPSNRHGASMDEYNPTVHQQGRSKKDTDLELQTLYALDDDLFALEETEPEDLEDKAIDQFFSLLQFKR